MLWQREKSEHTDVAVEERLAECTYLYKCSVGQIIGIKKNLILMPTNLVVNVNHLTVVPKQNDE